MDSKVNGKHQLIFDLTVCSIFIALAVSLKIIFFYIPGFDLSVYIICIAALFLKNKISLGVSLGVSFLDFFIEKSIVEWTSYLMVSLLICVIFIFLRKHIFKNKIILYSLLPILVLLYSTVSLFTWIGLYGKNEGYALYLANLTSAYVICFLYLIFTPLIFSPTLKLFENMFWKYSNSFNNDFNTYYDKKEDIMSVVSDKKVNYNVQLASMIFSMMLLTAYFSFLPYKLASWFNVHYLASILIVPVLMLLITPLWMKLAKKKSNKSVLQVNAIGLMFAIIFTFSAFATSNMISSTILVFVGICLFGIFIAGFLPINIEIIKSYEKRNNLKNKTGKYNALFGFLLIPFPFILDIFTKSTYVMFLFILIVLIIILMIICNKNIMSEGNVLNFDKNAIKTLKQNKAFFTQVFVQNYFIGFSKFLELSLCVFFFINFENSSISFNLNIKDNFVYLFIIFSFILKYLSQAIFKLIKYKNPNVNKIGIILIIFAIVSLICFFSIYKVENFENANLIFRILLLFLMIIFGAGYSIIENTKAKTYRKIVKENEFSLAMIIDHVMGNAFFSLIISAIFFIVIIFISLSLVNLIILMSVITIIGVILFSLGLLLRYKPIAMN